MLIVKTENFVQIGLVRVVEPASVFNGKHLFPLYLAEKVIGLKKVAVLPA